MEFFHIKGIVPPGRVHFRKYGLVELFSINDTMAEMLWKDKCPYVHLTDSGRRKYLNQEPITIQPIKTKKRRNAKNI